MRLSLCSLPLSLLCCVATMAQAGGSDAAAPAPPHLTFSDGTVTVGDQLATITLPPDCRYLAGDDARFWVEKIWHNPRDPDIVGLVVPSDLAAWYQATEVATDPDADIAAPARSWGMVVSWGGNSGHVDDADARKIDFDDLLHEMQDDAKAANPERLKAGYGSVELLGWAEPPHYDSEAKKLYWAKSLRFGNETQPTVNYCVRVLGARGVLEFNAVDEQASLAQLTTSAKQVLAKTDFTAGNRYADFKDGVDPVAAGGIAALITGGVLAKKAGLIAVIGVFLLKFAKLLILPLVIIGGWIMKKVRGA